MNRIWGRLGGQLGVGLCVLGFLLIFLGWNGAAGKDRIPSQFPYLISGGLAGLALVVVGAGLIVVQNQRADRAALQSSVLELSKSLDSLSAAVLSSNGSASAAPTTVPDTVVAGPSAFHTPSCRLVEGKTLLPSVSRLEAEERGLNPCRVCKPEVAARESFRP